MIHFGNISQKQFLQEYWQKKPLLIKNALPNFICPLSPEELAGLSCEEEFESRLVTGSTNNNIWKITNGPFDETTFSDLPKKEWTLLVQGVDRYIEDIYHLVNEFDFIPRWRFDDVMISYAASGGSVGPHYDYYDVFLLQGLGKRRWMISAQDCNLENYLSDTPLRIMKNFNEELVWDVEPGDIVYIPPKIAHHGVSLDDECLTLSIGYRSYSINEMSEALDLPQKSESNIYFKDPIWDSNQQSAEIPQIAIDAVKIFLKTKSLPDDYFGCFVTKLDSEDDKKFNEIIASYKQDQIHTGVTYELKPLCRIAYQHSNGELLVFVNGEVFDSSNIEDEIIIDFCNTKKILTNKKNWILAKRLSSLFLIQEHQL